MSKIERRIEAWLWTERKGSSRLNKLALRVARYAWALIEDLVAGELGLHSTSLVYSTILAAVPLLAFSFALLKGLGLQRELEPLLREVLAPLGAHGEAIADQVIGFVDNVSSSGLASVSLLLLVLAALMMAQKVEVSINTTWNVDRPRTIGRRFTDYVSFMLIGPILMSAALGIIAAVNSTALMNRLRAVEPFGDLLTALGKASPYLLVIAAFTVLYKLVPNTRVRLKPAAIGGLAGGAAWAGAGYVFATFVVNASRYALIYSSFAIVIVTMLWLNLSWLMLLLGSQLAFYVQNPEYLRRGTRVVELSPALGERLALSIMLFVGRAFDERKPGLDTEELAACIKLPRHFVEPVVAALVERRLLVETLENRLMPGDDLHEITLEEILDAVRALGGAGAERAASPAVAALAERIDLAAQGAVRGRSLADLIREAATAGSAENAGGNGRHETKHSEGAETAQQRAESADRPRPTARRR